MQPKTKQHYTICDDPVAQMSALCLINSMILHRLYDFKHKLALRLGQSLRASGVYAHMQMPLATGTRQTAHTHTHIHFATPTRPRTSTRSVVVGDRRRIYDRTFLHHLHKNRPAGRSFGRPVSRALGPPNGMRARSRACMSPLIARQLRLRAARCVPKCMRLRCH